MSFLFCLRDYILSNICYFVRCVPVSLLVLGYVLQALAPQKVEREPYEGAVIDLVTKVEEVKVTEAIPEKKPDDHIVHRPPTRGGGRNMQESSFAFSGEQITVERVEKCESPSKENMYI